MARLHPRATFFVFGVLILALSVGSALLTIRGVQALVRPRIRTKLLQNVIACAAGGLVVICGVYLILRVSGLMQLALTLVGGTGLIGLIVGITFRDITEKFLASIFLSMQPPFGTGDLVESSGVTGYVQQLNMRTTILTTLDGNLVQIPNASVYKSTLSNFSTNANRREEFVVGIGYDDAINEAQEIARKVLVDHPAVLNDPEPAVLADSLGRFTVNLRIYFWINAREYSWLKVCSSVIRLVKRAFQEHGISMPDEAREVVFPQGIPVTMLEGRPAEAHAAAQGKRPSAEARHQELDVVSTKAEAGLYSDAIVIEKQARQAQPLKEDENLLPGASASVLVGPYTGGVREQAATLVSQIDFNQVLLHGMLAFLLFAGSIQVSLEELAREWLPVALLAIFGTVVSTCIVGGVTWLVLGWLGLGIPFLHSLLFGAVILPTDPIAGCWES